MRSSCTRYPSMILSTRPHPSLAVLEQQKQLLCHTLFKARTSSGLYTDLAHMQHFGLALAASFSAIVIGIVKRPILDTDQIPDTGHFKGDNNF